MVSNTDYGHMMAKWSSLECTVKPIDAKQNKKMCSNWYFFPKLNGKENWMISTSCNY